jgi:hypothetical protein
MTTKRREVERPDGDDDGAGGTSSDLTKMMTKRREVERPDGDDDGTGRSTEDVARAARRSNDLKSATMMP